MSGSGDAPHTSEQLHPGAVRDPGASTAAVLAARQRPMTERLELALSWDSLAAELRAGLTAATGRRSPRK
jgi:hypothetical protein